MADENRLRQLFENLFRNSVEHSSTSSRPEAGDSVEHSSTSSQRPVGADDTVEHSSTTGPRAASETDPGVTVAVGDLPDGFYVEDDGPGIPEDRRSKVTDAGYSTREGGTGFGLGIVAAIVEAHGWTLTVTESEDGGARFEVTGVESTTSA
jgi:signal transduction histidine kinase